MYGGENCFAGIGNYMMRGDSALNVLKRRFANSEISQEEYLAKKAALSR